MRKLIAASSIALIAGVTAAAAQSSPSGSSSSGAASSGASVKLTMAQCDAIWEKADVSKSGSLSAEQAKPYISDFKAADTKGNGKLTKAEFQAACSKGIVHDTSSSGSSSGTSGSANSPSSGSSSGSSTPGMGSSGTTAPKR